MSNLFTMVTYVGTIFGILMLSISLYQIRKRLKESNNVTAEEFFSNNNKASLKKYIILSIIGITITSAMQLIRLINK